MPPSGFNQKAINGLLLFVGANYATIAQQYESFDGTEEEFLEQSASALEQQVVQLGRELPNATQLNGGLVGLQTFVAESYRDLAAEIRAGSDKYGRPVIDGKAIEKELTQIGDYLEKFSL
jgi:hypothetical protein